VAAGDDESAKNDRAHERLWSKPRAEGKAAPSAAFAAMEGNQVGRE
jgi:hypothetical protein